MPSVRSSTRDSALGAVWSKGKFLENYHEQMQAHALARFALPTL